MKSFAKRLKPGTDLQLGIEELAVHYNIVAGAIMSATGILSHVELTMVGGAPFSETGQFVLNSCTGTAAMDAVHLQLNLTTSAGETLKGEALEGCVVAEAVDVVVGAIESSVVS